jgi:hypothetical protein
MSSILIHRRQMWWSPPRLHGASSKNDCTIGSSHAALISSRNCVVLTPACAAYAPQPAGGSECWIEFSDSRDIGAPISFITSDWFVLTLQAQYFLEHWTATLALAPIYGALI